MSEDRLPKFIVLSLPNINADSYVCFTDRTATDGVRGYVRCEEKDIFSPSAKIRVDRSEEHENLVHLRCCHNNRYWERGGALDWIVASSNKPVEDITSPSCTLFEPIFLSSGNNTDVFLVHFYSRGLVVLESAGTDETMKTTLSVLDDPKGSDPKGSGPKGSDPKGSGLKGSDLSPKYCFKIVDCGTLVKLPKHVALKGDNGMYLKIYKDEKEVPFLQFSSGGDDEPALAFEIQQCLDGHVRVMHELTKMFWRLDSGKSWILADSKGEKDENTLFWPVKVKDNTIAFRTKRGKRICCRFTDDEVSNCLKGRDVSYVNKEAKLEMRELVSERSIYDVRFHMQDALIYDQTPLVVGTSSAENNTDAESSLAIKFAYEDTRTYSITTGSSGTAGITTTFEISKIPCIVGGEIGVSAEVTHSREEEETTEKKKLVEVTYTVSVPAKSRATVACVGTQGKCNVPFSYTRRDKRSRDMEFVTRRHHDGTFDGLNSYNFHFDQPKIERLHDLKKPKGDVQGKT